MRSFAFCFFLFFCSSLEGSVTQISDQGLPRVLSLSKRISFFTYIYSTELSSHADMGCRSWLRSLREGCLLAKYLETVRSILCFFFFSISNLLSSRGSSERNEEKTGKKKRWNRRSTSWLLCYVLVLVLVQGFSFSTFVDYPYYFLFFSFLFFPSFELTIERLITWCLFLILFRFFQVFY